MSKFVAAVKAKIGKAAHWVAEKVQSGASLLERFAHLLRRITEKTLRVVGNIAFVIVAAPLTAVAVVIGVVILSVVGLIYWLVQAITTLAVKATSLVFLFVAIVSSPTATVRKENIEMAKVVATRWRVRTAGVAAQELTPDYNEQLAEALAPEKEEIVIKVESVPASAKKNRPTPRQRKRRPARPEGGWGPSAATA